MTIYQLTQYCFFGFGVYNLVYLFCKHSKKIQEKINLTAIDKATTTTLILCGLIYLINFVYDWSLIFINSDSENSQHLFQRFKGPYGFSLYAQQATYIIISLLFSLQYVRQKSILRFFIGFLLLFNFERYVIIITTLHRDYLPSSWTMYQSTFGYILLDWIIKTLIFSSFTTVVYFIQNSNK
ncbi:hypothetical protein FIA58_018055 [Flavobacterium jejuense]|uniref:Uncharacterized protein n=1 Tax=Flavobacterium jejuense TaxID=1544455 RepID=A0ABX0IVU7_9FLAO|nr:hypothetical protein [Flavobacterium jejuense]NHN27588.1 hypothetical protein [Flavobacterium jejuense]